MVAITVILAAVIGTFVLGLGNQVKTSAPSANFDQSFDDDAKAGGAGELGGQWDNVSLTHIGGDALTAQNINLTATTDYNVVSAEGANLTEINPGYANASKSFDVLFKGVDPKDKVGAGDSAYIAVPQSNTMVFGGGTQGAAPYPSSSALATGELNGETFRIVWSPTDSDKSNVLKTIDFPS